MFRTFSQSWSLVKASYSVLRADKELMLFPIMSGIALILVSIAFFAPLIVIGWIGDVAEGQTANILGYVVLFLYYVATYFVMIFSNTAIVGAALKRLRGEDPTFADGFNIAMQNSGKILGFAIISATVGLILQAIRDRVEGIAGEILAAIGGAAWNLATFLVIPVIVAEGVGPIEALKRSAAMLRRTWGEQIVGNFSIGLVMTLLTLAGLIPGFILLVLATSALGVIGLILVGIPLALFVLTMMAVGSTLSGIYVAAVYNYANPQPAPAQNPFFSQDLLQGAFRHK